MNLLTRIFGLPHEALHLLGLLLVGRRAVQWTRTHVDIPDDLSLRDYIIVAGMPAFVFAIIGVLGAYWLVNARSYADAIPALLVVIVGGLALSGTSGDLELIAERLAAKKP